MRFYEGLANPLEPFYRSFQPLQVLQLECKLLDGYPLLVKILLTLPVDFKDLIQLN